MPRFAHLLTAIPKGSTVTVFACGRFAQFEERVDSGAIGITATENAYPLRVSIRPTVAGIGRGNLTAIAPIAGGIIDIVKAGGNFDIVINNVLEFNPGKERIFDAYDPRTGPWATAAQVIAPESDVTRVFQKVTCEACGKDIPPRTGKFCGPCSPRILTCEHSRLGATQPTPCGNPLLEGYECCKPHAEFLGIYKPKPGRPAKVRQVSPTERPKLKRGRKKKSAAVEIIAPREAAAH